MRKILAFLILLMVIAVPVLIYYFFFYQAEVKPLTIKENLTAQLKNNDEKLIFEQKSLPEQRAHVLYAGVHNTKKETLFFILNLSVAKVNLQYQPPCFFLAPGQVEVYNIRLENIEHGGNYTVKTEVYEFADQSCLTKKSLYAAKEDLMVISLPEAETIEPVFSS